MFIKTFKSKLIIIFIIIAIIPIGMIGLFVNLEVKNHIIKSETDKKTEFIDSEADKADIWFSDKEEILKSIQNNYTLLEGMLKSEDNFQELNNYLKKQVQTSESFQNIYITTKDGINFNSASIDLDFDGRTREWYTKAYSAKGIVWTQPYKDLITGAQVITLSRPLFDEKGKIQGVLGADFNFDKEIEKLGHVKINNNATTYMTTSEGKILKYFGEDVLQVTALDDRFEKVLSEDNGNMSIDLGKEYFIIYSTIPTTGWKVISLTDKRDFYESLTEINTYILSILMGTLVLVIFLSHIFIKQFSRPLEKIKEGALEIQKGNYNHKITIKNNDEFGQVAIAFNDMTDDLSKSYESLKSQSEQLININMELEASYEQLVATTDQLNDSDEKYRRLVENMHDLVWIVDNEWKLNFVNKHVVAMLGYDKKEILGKDIKDLDYILGDEQIKNRVFNIIKRKDIKNLEATLKTKHGKEIIIEFSTKRIYENGIITGIQGIARDITRRKKMEEEIIKRNKELVTINRISKELNSTMNLEKMLQKAVDDLIKLLHLPSCTIRLLTDDNTLKLKVYGGILTDLLPTEDIPVDEDIMGKAVKTGDIVRIENLSKKHMSKYSRKILESEEIKHVIFLPIKARGRILGTLNIASKNKLGESEFSILSSLVNQTAMIMENINLYQGLKRNYIKTIETLAAAVEAKDSYTEGHSYRVSRYSQIIAQKLGFSKKNCEDIKVAGILHDIGKIGISDTILTKNGRLSEEEYTIITKHPMIGSKILENVGFSENIMNGIKYHHSRYDLKGYPMGVELKELPLEASIIGVADAFDAMTSNRAYRSSMEIDEAIEELKRNKGAQFHPNIVDIMVDIYKYDRTKIIEIAPI